MSSRSLRCVLVGFLVTAFLSLGGPVSAEPADFPERPEAASLWDRACAWLMAQVSPVVPPPAGAPSPEAAASRDAGWTLDPNG